MCGGFISENVQGTNLQPCMSITCLILADRIASQALRTLNAMISGVYRAGPEFRAKPMHLILSFSAFCLEI